MLRRSISLHQEVSGVVQQAVVYNTQRRQLSSHLFPNKMWKKWGLIIVAFTPIKVWPDTYYITESFLPFQCKAFDKYLQFSEINRNYDCGHVENVISVNVNTYMDVEITFHHTFNSIPAVSPILLANTTGDTPLKIKAIVVKNSVSKTGCTIRIFNYNSIGIGIYLDCNITIKPITIHHLCNMKN